jgi:hypothetical protein
MRQMSVCAAIAAFLFLTWNVHLAATPAQTTPAKKTASKKTTSGKRSTTAKKSSPTRKPAGSGAARPTAARKGGKKAPSRTSWRNRQTSPTPDRYREIQQALAAKGYLNAEDATGVWNQNSVDALKRFQAEQKIVSTGKINSLSLIALGLGPKHETAAAKPPAPPQPPVPDAGQSRDR